MPFIPLHHWHGMPVPRSRHTGALYKALDSRFQKCLLVGCNFPVHKQPQVSWKSSFSRPWFPCNFSSLGFWIYFSGLGQPSFLRCTNNCLSWPSLSCPLQWVSLSFLSACHFHIPLASQLLSCASCQDSEPKSCLSNWLCLCSPTCRAQAVYRSPLGATSSVFSLLCLFPTVSIPTTS